MPLFPLPREIIREQHCTGDTTPTWNSDGGLATYQGNTYSYDALHRLTEVDNGVDKYLFSYDPTGRRVKKVVENSSGTVLSTLSKAGPPEEPVFLRCQENVEAILEVVRSQ